MPKRRPLDGGHKIAGERYNLRINSSVASGQDATHTIHRHRGLSSSVPLSPGPTPFLCVALTPMHDPPGGNLDAFHESTLPIIKSDGCCFLNYIPNQMGVETCKYYLLATPKKGALIRVASTKFFQNTCHQGKNGSGTWVAAANVSVLRVVKVAAHLL